MRSKCGRGPAPEVAGDRRLVVHNKADLAGAAEPPPGALAVSARTGAGCAEMLTHIETLLRAHEERIVITLTHADARIRAWLYQNARVVEESVEPSGIRLTAWIGPRAKGRLRAMLPCSDGTGRRPS